MSKVCNIRHKNRRQFMVLTAAVYGKWTWKWNTIDD